MRQSVDYCIRLSNLQTSCIVHIEYYINFANSIDYCVMLLYHIKVMTVELSTSNRKQTSCF